MHQLETDLNQRLGARAKYKKRLKSRYYIFPHVDVGRRIIFINNSQLLITAR